MGSAIKLSLVVTNTGKSQGKLIPVTRSTFLIGRDPECHLRPSSAIISKRHCGLFMREGSVFVQDFNSTNGTFVNDRQIRGEIQVLDGDLLRLGNLVFAVRIEKGVPVDRPTPLPPTKGTKVTAADEEAAAVLLALEGQTQPSDPKLDSDGNPPNDTTVMDLPAAAPATSDSPATKKDETKKTGDTALAAKAILDKYIRRPRS